MTALTPAFLSRILGLKLRAQAVLEGALAGTHRSPFHGYSSEFAQYKGYVPGDDLRHLDWKAYARRDQLVTRQYRDETNTTVHLLLDTSASMGYRNTPGKIKADEFSKLETARTLAAALTVLAERQRDTVSLASGAATLETFFPAGSGPRATVEVLTRLEGFNASGTTDLDGLFTQEAARITGQSFVFLFTDLWQNSEPVAAGLRRIRRKSRAATVVQLRTRDEDEFFTSGTFSLRDMETGETLEVDAAPARAAYTAALQEHSRLMAEACSKLNVRLITVRTDEPLDHALRRILPQ
jgi:uncharacterized protein (DUF58 family)